MVSGQLDNYYAPNVQTYSEDKTVSNENIQVPVVVSDENTQVPTVVSDENIQVPIVVSDENI